MVAARRLIRVDGKVRSDINYPCGFMDVVSIDKSNEQYRLLYDTKGRFILHSITAEEGGYKLCRVQQTDKAKKASIGHNPFHPGQTGVIPYLVTHDARTIRYPDPAIHVNDTVKVDVKSGAIVGHLKFDVGQMVFITRGANQGRIGWIVTVDKHPGSFDIIHVRDARGQNFATRMKNVFVIGEGKKEWISLPKAKGIKTTIFEDRDKRAKKAST